jgi:hypothetical protein
LGLPGDFVDQRDIEQWQERRGEKGDMGPDTCVKSSAVAVKGEAGEQRE